MSFRHYFPLKHDEDGDFQTTVIAIDAKRFKNMPRESQYEESALLRELNKALVGFYNPEVGTQILRTPSGCYLCARSPVVQFYFHFRSDSP